MMHPHYRVSSCSRAGALARSALRPSISLLVVVVAACAAADETNSAEPDGKDVIVPDDGGNEAAIADASVDIFAASCAVGNLCSASLPQAVGAVTAISGRSNVDVWASATGGVLVHWDGQQWKKLDSVYNDTLSSIFVTPDEMWGISGTRVLRRKLDPNSVRSARVNLSYQATYQGLTRIGHGRGLSGIAVLPSGDVYVSIAPWEFSPKVGDVVGHLDFDTTTLTFLPDPAYPESDQEQEVAYRASFLVPDRALWVVGDQATVARYPISLTGDGGAPSLERGVLFRLPYHADLLAGWAYGEQFWAAGRYGTILRFDGAEWHDEASPTKETLNAIFGLAPNDIWAAGDNGTVLHFDGKAWVPIAAPGYDGRLTAIWASAPDDVWFGGEGGMFHWGELP